MSVCHRSSFFRFLLQKGGLQADLAASVPTVVDWRLSTAQVSDSEGSRTCAQGLRQDFGVKLGPASVTPRKPFHSIGQMDRVR
jgi:hypothetical protein